MWGGGQERCEMRRRLLMVLSLLSLLLFVAVVTVWVRSFWYQNGYAWQEERGPDVIVNGDVATGQGNLVVNYHQHRLNPAGREIGALMLAGEDGWYSLSLAETERPPWSAVLWQPRWQRNSVPLTPSRGISFTWCSRCGRWRWWRCRGRCCGHAGRFGGGGRGGWGCARGVGMTCGRRRGGVRSVGRGKGKMWARRGGKAMSAVDGSGIVGWELSFIPGGTLTPTLSLEYKGEGEEGVRCGV